MDGLAERMIQTMEDILRRLQVQLAYNTSQHSTTGKTAALVKKGWNLLLPVDHLKKNLLTIHPTAKASHEMWKKACDTAARCIAEAKDYNKQRKKNTTPPEIVEEEDSPGPVKKIIKARKIRLDGKYQREYLVRFKNQTAYKAKWLAEDAIPDENLHLREFRAPRRTEQSHQ
ncbi:hypothetical protein O181_009875 [Austropuccinia psidii MF-1]|uniref:Chromo domain-containing protein n=1 Tax=Austropuccinia psidii MF-1 TaxID=1389203 RepID=A0A9Q3BST4_9BASI|nr:hypothetical protein [Austropuccinia psidii MF-1]